MHWIIQDGVFGDETVELIKHVKSYQLVSDWALNFEGGRPYIVRGTTKFIKDTYNRWAEYVKMPNLLHLDNYQCSNYYLEIPEEKLLNSDFLLLPWWKLKRSRYNVFEYLNAERLFIRPNSGEKLFTGTTISHKWFKKELEIIEGLPSSNFDQQDLVLVSSAKEVWNECRFLMQKNKIVSWAPYGEHNTVSNDYLFEDYESLVTSNRYYPDSFYTIDVCTTFGGPQIVELNSFVSAGLYEMDYSLVVKAVEDLYAKN